jgi:hypothetical protein
MAYTLLMVVVMVVMVAVAAMMTLRKTEVGL